MKQRPGAEALLDAAIATLQEDLLPHFSGRQKFLAAMITRAISVARQEIAGATAAAQEERHGLAHLYGHAASGHTASGHMASGHAAGDDLIASRRQLAQDIRARKFLAGTPAETRLIDHLVATTAQELRISNLKYLAQRQRGRGAESAV